MYTPHHSGAGHTSTAPLRSWAHIHLIHRATQGLGMQTPHYSGVGHAYTAPLRSNLDSRSSEAHPKKTGL